MKKNIYILSIIFILSSCSTGYDVPHFDFTSNDFNHIPTSYENVGKILTFKSENNQELSFEIIRYDFSQITTHRIVRDAINVAIQVHNNADCNTRFTVDIVKDLESELQQTFYSCTRELRRIISPYSNDNLQTMIIDNITYDKVIILTANAFISNQGNTINLKKVYYDLKKGFIGFDEDNNLNSYRIVTN